MAKNGPNDLIFGKLIIFNDFKRFDWGFLKISIFGRFFAFFGQKSPFSAQKCEKTAKNRNFQNSPIKSLKIIRNY